MSFEERLEKLKTPGISGIKSVTIEKWIAYGIFLLLLLIPTFTSLYNMLVFGKIISYMIFALALDILWGYAGLMNLGFALFFGVRDHGEGNAAVPLRVVHVLQAVVLRLLQLSDQGFFQGTGHGQITL